MLLALKDKEIWLDEPGTHYAKWNKSVTEELGVILEAAQSRKVPGVVGKGGVMESMWTQGFRYKRWVNFRHLPHTLAPTINNTILCT